MVRWGNGMTDLIGAVFGNLTVVRESENRVGRNRQYVCSCDCGRETLALPTKLRSGHKKSCGCLRANGSHLKKMTESAVKANTRSLVGVRFGRLVVTSEPDTLHVWCRCDCGSEVIKSRTAIGGGNNHRRGMSCGCIAKERMRSLQKKRTEAHRLANGFKKTDPMSPINKTLRNQMREIKTAVLRRDAYRCVLCEAHGVKFHIHHIETWLKNPSLRFDQHNLVTLCRSCHIDRAHGGNVHREACLDTATILKEYIRRWVCSDCGADHDRDVNAAQNILRVGAERRPLVEEIPVL